MDDEVLGLGGTTARHVSEGDEVYVCFVAHRVYEHKYDEGKNKVEMESALAAKDVLGYRKAEFFNLNDERLDAYIQDVLIPLEAHVKRIKPDIVYVCHGGVNHQDHKDHLLTRILREYYVMKFHHQRNNLRHFPIMHFYLIST